jgi:hypothetical protein
MRLHCSGNAPLPRDLDKLGHTPDFGAGLKLREFSVQDRSPSELLRTL